MQSDDLATALAYLRPLIGETADALWLAALVDPTSSADVLAIAQALSAQLLGQTYSSEQILLLPPDKLDAGGDYPLGWVMYAGKPRCSFGLRDLELSQHIAILGRSGAGKSNVAYLLAWNLLRHGKPFMVLDWRRNYAHLARRPEGRSLVTLGIGTPKQIAFNPLLASPLLGKVERQAYLRELISALCNACLPGPHLLSTRGAEHLLMKGIQELSAQHTEPLTFNDVRAWLNAYKARSREVDWKVSATSVLTRLTTGPLGQVFNADAYGTLSDLLHRSVILEIDALGNQADRAAFVNALLLWLYYHRLAEGRSQRCKHVLFIEEAHHCFLRHPHGHHSLPELMLRQMRDLGQALVLIDQNPSLLSVPALGNTATTVCLNLNHADDVDTAGRALTLPEEQRHYIGRLQVGEAIVKLPRAHLAPFVVRFPRFPTCEALVPVPEKTSLLRTRFPQRPH